jgi:hypothetical protein
MDEHLNMNNERGGMKCLVKVFVLLLSLALVFSFAACGTPKDAIAPGTPSGISRTTPENDITPTFSWNAATDDGSGIDYYLVNIDGGEWANVGDVTTYALDTALSDGSHTFKVKAVDKAGNEGDEGSSTFTCDTTAPTISNIAASGMTTSRVTITWTTNESATSQVEYGVTTSYGSSSVLDSSLVTTHTVNLTRLTASTTYHYGVKSKDVANNEAISGDNSFTTPAPPDTTAPVISWVASNAITTSEATITWDTDEASTSQVQYGSTTGYGSVTTLDSSPITSHRVALTGLASGTTYHYRVISKDASNNEAASDDKKFDTVPLSYNISDALAQGLVTVTVAGFPGSSFSGASSGDVIEMTFLRQKPETMKIVVPLGTSLVSNDPACQNMVVLRLRGRDPDMLGYYPVHEIVLDKDEEQDFLFEAYCLTMQRANIHFSTTFSIVGPASQEIITMLTAALTPKATITATQVALWALTDDPSLDEVRERFTADDLAIADAWAILDRAGLNPGSRRLFADYTP